MVLVKKRKKMNKYRRINIGQVLSIDAWTVRRRGKRERERAREEGVSPLAGRPCKHRERERVSQLTLKAPVEG